MHSQCIGTAFIDCGSYLSAFLECGGAGGGLNGGFCAAHEYKNFSTRLGSIHRVKDDIKSLDESKDSVQGTVGDYNI